MPQPANQLPPLDTFEQAAAEAIALCGGDARAAVHALVVANNRLEEENAGLLRELGYFRIAVSSGFSRQWHHRRWPLAQE